MAKGKEQWKVVPGYEGFYEVSNRGRVRSWCLNSSRKKRTSPVTKKDKCTNVTNHRYVALRDRLAAVRLLVAKAFVEPFHGDEVKHLNGDVRDNRAENLIWWNGDFENIDGEKWENVNGHEWYDVSNMGRVRSWKSPFFYGRRLSAPILIKPIKVSTRYRHVMLDGDQCSVHVLVAEAFLGETPDGMEVNHRNSDRGDNRLENLEYMTHRRNVIHGAMKRRGLPTGVYDKGNFYQVLIRYKGVLVHLGVTKDVEVASRLYQKALDQIERGCFSPKRIKEKLRRRRRWAS